MEPLIILVALLAGLVFRRFGFPPLPGYLLAGFVCHGLGIGDVEQIENLADVGITLLLFTIGLKLNIRELASPQVWGVAASHTVIATTLTALVIVASGIAFPVLALDDLGSAVILAFALSFSSTVFAVKVFDERGETASIHAKLAIGILVIQDLMAVTYLVFMADSPPSIYAIGLFALPLLRPVLLKMLTAAGHGELLVLFGIAVALGVAELFDVLHLKAGLGALVAGVLLANSEKSKELYRSLISLKDLFLVGFFLHVGYYGLPSGDMMLVAGALAMLIFIRPILYFFLFTVFRLRAWTSLQAGLSLFNYSEFGLIVAAIATADGVLPVEWMTTLALAVSVSFFIATPFNENVQQIFRKYGERLKRFERRDRLPEEISADLGNAGIVVVGMGRVGRGVYTYLQGEYPDEIVGVEENYERVLEHRARGFNCVHADANDVEFWANAQLYRRRLILVSLTNHSENLTVVGLARQFGYQNQLAVVARFNDEQKELEDLGCISFNLYGEAGHGFAEHVMSEVAMKPDGVPAIG